MLQELTFWGLNKMAEFLQMTFQIHFLRYFVENVSEICSHLGPADNKWALVQVMAGHQMGDEP